MDDGTLKIELLEKIGETIYQAWREHGASASNELVLSCEYGSPLYVLLASLRELDT